MKTLFSGEKLDLGLTLHSGQAFRWRELTDGAWRGIIGENRYTLLQTGKPDEPLRMMWDGGLYGTNEALEYYFDLDEQYEKKLNVLREDSYLSGITGKYPGLRLLKQERWECLASFVLSTACNIPRITGMIERLCERFGETHEDLLGIYHIFPTLERLCEASEEELRSLGLGFRAGYIASISRRISRESGFLESVAACSYEDAAARLMELRGVGRKVADCVLLFSFGYTDAFPADTWISRIVSEAYLSGGNISAEKTGEYGRQRFGKNAGLAQQYLFVHARDKSRRRTPAG